MRDAGVPTIALWVYVTMVVCLLIGCPDTSSGSDAAVDATTADTINDLADASTDASLPEDHTADAPPRDVVIDQGGMDVPSTGCVPGMSIACACTDGRMGAQVCLSDHTYGDCRCTTADGGMPDVVLPPLGARLIAPQSVSRVTSRRPTMRWVLPDGVTRARVEVCGDRACTRVLATGEVIGTSWRPTTMLPAGVAYWRVRGLNGDGGVAWSSPTWEYVVGQRDAPVDTSFGTIKDFNGDGFDDVVLQADTGLPNYGRAHIFLGSSVGGPSGADHQTLDAPTRGAQIGRIATGDLDGDGYADLAIWSYAEITSVIQVRYGGPMGLPRDPSLSLESSGGGGWGLSSPILMDLDGDGFSDLVALASRLVSGREEVEFRLYPGGIDGVAMSPTSNIPISVDSLAYSVALADDVNGDGYPDLIGYDDQRNESGTTGQGIAWLIAGHPTSPFRTWMPLAPPTPTYHFGGYAGGIGDVNGDGVADFAIRSDEEVSIYLGATGTFTTRPFRTIANPEARCYLATFGFGSSIGHAGDFDGDGRADLVVGARCLPFVRMDRLGVGSVYVYPGTSAGVSATPAILRGIHPEAGFGLPTGGIGDFDGDGLGDLMAAASIGVDSSGNGVPGAVFIFRGSSMGLSASRVWILEQDFEYVGQHYAAMFLGFKQVGA